MDKIRINPSSKYQPPLLSCRVASFVRRYPPPLRQVVDNGDIMKQSANDSEQISNTLSFRPPLLFILWYHGGGRGGCYANTVESSANPPLNCCLSNRSLGSYTCCLVALNFGIANLPYSSSLCCWANAVATARAITPSPLPLSNAGINVAYYYYYYSQHIMTPRKHCLEWLRNDYEEVDVALAS